MAKGYSMNLIYNTFYIYIYHKLLKYIYCLYVENMILVIKIEWLIYLSYIMISLSISTLYKYIYSYIQEILMK